ncbi:MAG TPA: hypothetical protein VNY52_07930 [Solirubrobacteraceae bacterium]|nr:hypothetical protein [Solirubrobacteraceae bacterium]
MADEETAKPVRSAAHEEASASVGESGATGVKAQGKMGGKAEGKDVKASKKAGGKGAKAAGGKGSADTAGTSSSLTLAGHPRAVRGVARAKAWGGLGGFLLGGYLSLPTHTLAEAGLRALAAGVVCYVAVWAAAVFLWRRLVVAELRDAQQELLAAELARLGLSDPTTPPALERGRAGVTS